MYPHKCNFWYWCSVCSSDLGVQMRMCPKNMLSRAAPWLGRDTVTPDYPVMCIRLGKSWNFYWAKIRTLMMPGRRGRWGPYWVLAQGTEDLVSRLCTLLLLLFLSSTEKNYILSCWTPWIALEKESIQHLLVVVATASPLSASAPSNL